MQDFYSQEMIRDRIKDLECELEYRRQSADGWVAEPSPLAWLGRWFTGLVNRRSVAPASDQSEASSRVA